MLGLIWQLIKMFLFKRISVAQIPGLVNLLRPGEDVTELLKLSPEQLLLRWVNFQLEKVGVNKDILMWPIIGSCIMLIILKEEAKKKGKQFFSEFLNYNVF